MLKPIPASVAMESIGATAAYIKTTINCRQWIGWSTIGVTPPAVSFFAISFAGSTIPASLGGGGAGGNALWSSYSISDGYLGVSNAWFAESEAHNLISDVVVAKKYAVDRRIESHGITGVAVKSLIPVSSTISSKYK